MKDFCMKHPIIAYLMLNEILVTITNIVYERKRRSTAEEVIDIAGETVAKVKEQVSTTAKQPIGFVAK